MRRAGARDGQPADALADGGAVRQAVGLDDASAAVAYAAGQDWLLAEGQPPHSICLTEGGRVMVAKLKRRQARPMAKQRRYSIEIKDDTGKTVIFTPKGR